MSLRCCCSHSECHRRHICHGVVISGEVNVFVIDVVVTSVINVVVVLVIKEEFTVVVVVVVVDITVIVTAVVITIAVVAVVVLMIIIVAGVADPNVFVVSSWTSLAESEKGKIKHELIESFI